VPPRPVAVVTGASTGIGRAVAVALGELGWGVAVGARRADRLAETEAAVREAGGEPFAHPLDVTDPASIETFLDAATASIGPVDVLVNNAGVANPGWLHEVSVDALERDLATNLLGPICASRLVVGSLRARGARGHLVFVTSDATRHARPRMAAYTATKAGLEAFAASLSMECEGTGIRVTTVRVGPTVSEFGFAWDPEEVGELLSYWPRYGLQRHNGMLAAEDVARAVVTAVTAPPGVVVDTLEVQPEAPVDDDRTAQAVERPGSGT